MPTVNKDIADAIKANNGRYADDPRVYRIVEYDNAFGGVSYGLEYRVTENRYCESEYVRNPRVYWQAK